MQHKPDMAESSNALEDNPTTTDESPCNNNSTSNTMPNLPIEDPAIIASSDPSLASLPEDESSVCSSRNELNGIPLMFQTCTENGHSSSESNGHCHSSYENGHLSPSDDSGIGDHSSQSSQSPNQSFLGSHLTNGQVTLAVVDETCVTHLGASGYNEAQVTSVCTTASTSFYHQRTQSASGTVSSGVPPATHAHGSQNNPSPPQRYSPHSHLGSRGESPTPHSSLAQHVVHVVVNPGETFSVRIGDQIQHIQGPATVRMVSSNGPPVPMPMQVPPGHMVQQIVDENGILTHVILSPQHGLGAPMTVGYHGTPANGTPQHLYTPPYTPCFTFPNQFSTGPSRPHGPGHVPYPSTHTGQGVTAGPSAAPPCSNHSHQHNYSHGASHSKDERGQRMREKLQNKHRQRILDERPTSRRQAAPMKNQPKLNGDASQRSTDGGQSSGSSVDGTESEEDRLIKDALSNMLPPMVSDIAPKSALISLAPPDLSQLDISQKIEVNLHFLLRLLDKNSNKKDCYNSYNEVYRGTATVISLTDLTPNTEYHVKVGSIYSSIEGECTESTCFRTAPCEPDEPQPPKCSAKSKSTLTLKWNAPNDNGNKITAFVLECDKGDGNYEEVYKGIQKQTKLPHLTPSTTYTFRLSAVNSLGKSTPSEAVAFATSGTAPPTPDVPELVKSSVRSLTISWKKRPCDDEFTLQMEDQSSGHGFLPVYTGQEQSYNIKNLRRNTDYKFRLQSCNEEGASKWSDTVCYKTTPDHPGPPGKPQLKGKTHPTNFKITWDAPKDTGGTEVTGYIVEVDAGAGFVKMYEGPDREFNCDNLEPGHSYRVHVSCYNSGGASEFSECLVVTTQAVAPGMCQQPAVAGKPKANSVCLRWAYPDNTGGAPLLHFEVQMVNSENTTRQVYSGPDLNCVVAGLLPGRHYLFQVRAVNKAGPGPWSDILEVVSGAGVPDAPRPPTLQCRSLQAILVSWEEPFHNGSTITDYRLEWQNHPETDFSQLYHGSHLEYEVRGLVPAKQYSFRVQAVNSAGMGPPSLVSTCVTPPSSPGQVVTVRASTTADSVHMTWKEPVNNGSEITGYIIELTGEERTALQVDNVQEYIVENLTPETSYRIRVQAVNSIGAGPFSAAIKVTTRPLPPLAPHMEWVASTYNSIKVKWGDGKSSENLQYCLEMLKDNGSFYPVYQGSALFHKINRLQEMFTYEFRINARNEAGDGPYSPIYRFSTTKAPPPVVKDLQVNCQSVEHCAISWTQCKPMGKDKLEYTLQLQEKDGGWTEIHCGSRASHTLEHLLPCADYFARVCAVRVALNDSGETLTGPYSPVKCFTTPALAANKTSIDEPPKNFKERVGRMCRSSVSFFKLKRKLSTSDTVMAVICLVLFSVSGVLLAMMGGYLITSTENSVTSDQSAEDARIVKAMDEEV